MAEIGPSLDARSLNFPNVVRQRCGFGRIIRPQVDILAVVETLRLKLSAVARDSSIDRCPRCASLILGLVRLLQNHEVSHFDMRRWQMSKSLLASCLGLVREFSFNLWFKVSWNISTISEIVLLGIQAYEETLLAVCEFFHTFLFSFFDLYLWIIA